MPSPGVEACRLVALACFAGWFGRVIPTDSKADRAGPGTVTPAKASPASTSGISATAIPTLATNANLERGVAVLPPGRASPPRSSPRERSRRVAARGRSRASDRAVSAQPRAARSRIGRPRSSHLHKRRCRSQGYPLPGELPLDRGETPALEGLDRAGSLPDRLRHSSMLRSPITRSSSTARWSSESARAPSGPPRTPILASASSAASSARRVARAARPRAPPGAGPSGGARRSAGGGRS